jgi:uncharacterized RDD family membrane protein YckC
MTEQSYTPHVSTAVAAPGNVQVATVGDRVLARVIDALICIGAFLALWGPAELIAHLGEHSASNAWGIAGGIAVALLMACAFAFGFLYEWLLVGLRGATIGKSARRIKVVNQSTGAPIGLRGSFVRLLLPVIGFFFCFVVGTVVVYLSVLFDKSGRRQGWHDKVANDVVIKTPKHRG